MTNEGTNLARFERSADMLYAYQWGEEVWMLEERQQFISATESANEFIKEHGHDMELYYFFNCGLNKKPELCWEEYSK